MENEVREVPVSEGIKEALARGGGRETELIHVRLFTDACPSFMVRPHRIPQTSGILQRQRSGGLVHAALAVSRSALFGRHRSPIQLNCGAREPWNKPVCVPTRFFQTLLVLLLTS